MKLQSCHKVSHIFLLALGLLLVNGCQNKQFQEKTEAPEVPKTQTTEPIPQASLQKLNALYGTEKQKRLEAIGDASEEDKATLKTVFSEFKHAVLSYKGGLASSMLSESSLKYYENILFGLRMAMFEPKQFKAIETRLSATNRATIKIMSERLSPSFVASADALQLYETAFNQGWIGYKTMQTASIDYMRTFKDNGKRYIMADFYYAGTMKDKHLNQIGFVWENEQWKIDLVPIFLTLDEAIQKRMEEKQLDTELSIDLTVDSTREALEPKAWKLAKYPKDNFIAGFPRAPLFVEDNGTRIYTSMHHIYGQFDIRVSYYDGNHPDSPYQVKSARDEIILGFLNPLGVTEPRCEQHIVGKDIMIKCDFWVKEPASQGKSVWFFTPDRVYQLFNLARSDKYNDGAAATFMQRFAYGMKS